MEEDESRESKGFKVTDRRMFSSSEGQGQGQEQGQETAGKGQSGKPAEAAVGAQPVEAPAPPKRAPSPRQTVLPPVDFHTFIISIGSSALMSLGVVEDPLTGKRERDLPLAKHNIDLLAMLEEKTRGNLSADESRLVASLLFDLRLKYVEAVRGNEPAT